MQSGLRNYDFFLNLDELIKRAVELKFTIF